MSTYQRNEAGNAQIFEFLTDGRVRYDHKRQSWFQFQEDKRRWIQDDINFVRHYAVQCADFREKQAVTIADEKTKGQQFKYASDSKNVRNIDATLKLAASLPAIAFDKTWDSDPLLFQVENGVVDLRTGELRDAKLEDYLLSRSPVTYNADAKCPRWDLFLKEVFENKTDIIDFVQQCVGYTLTGITKEEALFCVFGEAGTGKSKFITVLGMLLGDYYTPINKETLFQTSNRIIGDGASLPGKRFVTGSEASGKGELDTEKIKTLTGNDRIVVRPLYKPEYSFLPQFKLWLAFNSRPTIIDHTGGVWRRLKMIPFDHPFEGDKRDFDLIDKLKPELPGILNWAIEGCLKWQKLEHGLQNPETIETLNQAYRDDFNPFTQFLSDQCVLHSDVYCGASDFYKRYVSWCKEQDEKPIGKTKVAEQLRAMGINKRKPTSGIRQQTYFGVELLNKRMNLSEALAATPMP